MSLCLPRTRQITCFRGIFSGDSIACKHDVKSLVVCRALQILYGVAAFGGVQKVATPWKRCIQKARKISASVFLHFSPVSVATSRLLATPEEYYLQVAEP